MGLFSSTAEAKKATGPRSTTTVDRPVDLPMMLFSSSSSLAAASLTVVVPFRALRPAPAVRGQR